MRPTLGAVLRTLGQVTAAVTRRLPMTVAIGQRKIQLTICQLKVQLRAGGRVSR
jgi:hypothetical protein